MRPVFQPSLVNGPSGDPALYVDILFERRALLIDLGDIAALPPRKLLRVCLGRERPLALFGPERFIDQVEHKPAAFTWNLVANMRRTDHCWSNPRSRSAAQLLDHHTPCLAFAVQEATHVHVWRNRL